MISKIKEIYKEKCIIDEMPKYPNDYYWFKTADHHLIGISKTINSGEKRLLSAMLDEVTAVDFDYRTRLLWLDILSGNVEAQLQVTQKSLKFILFNHGFEAEAKTDFELLVKAFNDRFLTLFLDSGFGVILDFQGKGNDELEAFVDAARQDFYYELTFYETPVYELDASIGIHFSEELTAFKKHINRGKSVIKKQDLLLESLAMGIRGDVSYEGFRDKIKELPMDTLELVTAYLENNFNLSLVAKEMHMHRNTCMNKLDKFTEATGLNVKEFEEAILAYLLVKGG